MIICPFSEMLISCKDGLTKIQQKYLYSVLCPKGCLDVCKIAAFDTVQCNDDAQGKRTISFIKKIVLES